MDLGELIDIPEFQLHYYEKGWTEPDDLYVLKGKLAVPRFDEDETILLDIKPARARILVPRFGGGPQVMFHDTGEGHLWRTDVRWVFLRHPKPDVFERQTRGREDWIDLTLRARQWKRDKKREGFSVSTAGVLKMKRSGADQSVLHLRHEGRKIKIILRGAEVGTL